MDAGEFGRRCRRLPVLGIATLAISGCGVGLVPRQRLDEATRLTQVLRSENAQLKDLAYNLRSENQDLTQRAVDDAKALKTLEAANDQLEDAIAGYQEDREQLSSSFEKIQRLAQESGGTRFSNVLQDRINLFVRDVPGAEFDRESNTITIPTDGLFEPRSNRLTTEGERRLRDLGAIFASEASEPVRLHVAGHIDTSSVRRTGASSDADHPSTDQDDLSLSRAVRAREVLAKRSGLPATSFSVAGHGGSRPIVDGPNDLGRGRNRRLEISISPGTPSRLPLKKRPILDADNVEIETSEDVPRRTN